MDQKIKNDYQLNSYVISFTIPILIVLCVHFLLNLYPFSNERLAMSGDFYLQYLPLYRSLRSAFWSFDWSEFYWSFHKGLGGAMTAVYGFNSLSPLTFLYVIFPVKWYPIATLLMSLLRYGLSSLTFYIFLRHRQKTRITHQSHSSIPILMAIIYALSGFIVSQFINPNFLDNLIYLPLLTLELEKLLEGKKSIVYPFILSLMMITQFYFGYMTCLWIIIYGIDYVVKTNVSLKRKIQRYLYLGLMSVIGIALAAFWLIPLFFNLLESKAAAGETFQLTWEWLNQPFNYLTKFFVGAINGEEWGGYDAYPQMYLSLLGLLALIFYFVSDTIQLKNKFISMFTLVIIGLSFSQSLFEQIWHMGQRPNGFYFRNSWVFNIYALILGYEALVTNYETFKRQNDFKFITLIIMLLSAYLSNNANLRAVGIVISCLILVVMLLIFKHLKAFQSIALISLVCFELTANTYFAYKDSLWLDRLSPMITLTESEKYLPLINDDKAEFSRVELQKDSSRPNYNYFYETKGLAHFTSSLEYAQIELFKSLGLPSSTSIVNYNQNPEIDALLNVDYYLSNQHPAEASKNYLDKMEKAKTLDNGKILYHNQNTLGLATLVDQTFLTLTLDNNNPIDNHQLILNHLFEDHHLYYQAIEPTIKMSNVKLDEGNLMKVNLDEEASVSFSLDGLNGNDLYFVKVPRAITYDLKKLKMTLNDQPYWMQDRFIGDQIWPLSMDTSHQMRFDWQLNDSLTHLDFNEIKFYQFDWDLFTQSIKEKQQETIRLKSFSNRKIILDAQVTKDQQAIFFSIPYNSGWTVKLNGRKVESVKVWDSLMGIRIPKGEYVITLNYYPPGFKVGGWLSISTLIVYLFTLFIQKIERN